MELLKAGDFDDDTLADVGLPSIYCNAAAYRWHEISYRCRHRTKRGSRAFPLNGLVGREVIYAIDIKEAGKPNHTVLSNRTTILFAAMDKGGTYGDSKGRRDEFSDPESGFS